MFFFSFVSFIFHPFHLFSFNNRINFLQQFPLFNFFVFCLRFSLFLLSFFLQNKKAHITEAIIWTDFSFLSCKFFTYFMPNNRWYCLFLSLSIRSWPPNFLKYQECFITLRLLAQDQLTYSMCLTKSDSFSDFFHLSLSLQQGKDLLRILTGFRSKYYRYL